MNLTCARDPFYNAAQATLRAVLPKSTIPALTGLLITTTPEGVTVSGTDLELGIEARFPAQIREEGQVLLPARYLVGILRSLPEGELTLAENQGEERVLVTAGASRFELLTLPAADFPAVVPAEAAELARVPEPALRTLIQQVSFAAARDGLRQLLTAVLFSLRGDTLRLVATDGHRLAIAEGAFPGAGAEGEYLVPARSLEELARLAGGAGEITIAAASSQLLFHSENWALISRLVEGKYLPYESVLPRQFSLRARVKRLELLAALERAELLSAEKMSAVHLHVYPGGIKVLAQSADVGRLEEELPAAVEGEELDVAFNGRYLIEPLRILAAEEVLFEFTGPESAAVISLPGSSSYRYLVMPVTVRAAV
ncbi:DNA polymerase III subunit beta [Gelria sp. Kuro-4]|uniref:DNA polymerase III subunit beta n=1 Tax=Gelria sp. Kuro-4 TaxID=2796927 RepID=UPI001BED7F8A|nr:DNA polymerase III subunit beta [Gelria sp. Kuro-4]MDK2927944.1 polymerase subunit beta [Bacillota bacterium]BCV23767.1 DNA polymerase III subunit beta [Gelria sp. Kuro-4]